MIARQASYGNGGSCLVMRYLMSLPVIDYDFESSIRMCDDAVNTAANLPPACLVISARLLLGYPWSVASMT